MKSDIKPITREIAGTMVTVTAKGDHIYIWGVNEELEEIIKQYRNKIKKACVLKSLRRLK